MVTATFASVSEASDSPHEGATLELRPASHGNHDILAQVITRLRIQRRFRRRTECDGHRADEYRQAWSP